MARKILLSGEEVIGYVEYRLRPYLGVAAEIANHLPLVEAVLQDYLLGETPDSVRSMVLAYGVPSDVASEIQEHITSDLVGTVNRGLQRVYPGRIYRYQLFPNGDALIEEYTPHELAPQVLDVESEPDTTGAMVSSSIRTRLPINAISGGNVFEATRRLQARMSTMARRTSREEDEEEAEDKDPQFAHRKLVVGV